ncbi:MAG: DUF3365 domain-containing protein [Hyellaceae cyanobacterium CSU_1_1]|nr:DUF3365 domain-containing protein [Hyellaceae cyanobacterium CSU_1_1]
MKLSRFFFKDATLEPLNPRDKADDFETGIIEDFKKHQQIRELRGFRSTSKKNLFYLARPIKVYQPTCLACHGEPSAAPPSLVERYGSSSGFRWKLNEIVGMEIVSIPVDYFAKESRQLFLAIAGVAGAIFFSFFCRYRFGFCGNLDRLTNKNKSVELEF